MTTPIPPTGPHILRADGTRLDVEIKFLSTEPMYLEGDIYIIDRWMVTTETFYAAGDRITADVMPDNCSIVARHVGAK